MDNAVSENLNVNQTDVQLVRASMQGDSRAFGMLVQRLRGPLCGYLGGLLRRRDDDVEEIAQQSLLIAWQKIPTLKDPERFSSWLFRIARNLAIKSAGLPRPGPLAVDPPQEHELDPADERLAVLAAAVAELSEPHREVILRKHFRGASGQQIAAELGIAAGTVWSRLSRAYAELREKLSAVETEER